MARFFLHFLAAWRHRWEQEGEWERFYVQEVGMEERARIDVGR